MGLESDVIVNFDKYKSLGGELDKEKYDNVRRYSQGKDSYIWAEVILSTCINDLQESDKNVAAKLIGLLHRDFPANQNAAPNPYWLATETYLLQGKDPKPIFDKIWESL